MILIIWTTTQQRASMSREEADTHYGADWVQDALDGVVPGVVAEEMDKAYHLSLAHPSIFSRVLEERR